MNDENLIPVTKRTPRERKEIARKGAIASNKKQKEKRMMKEQLSLLLSLPLQDEKAKAKMKSLGINTDNLDNQMALLISMYQKALKGDVQAFNSIRDTSGNKPIDQVEANVTANTSQLDGILKQIKEDD